MTSKSWNTRPDEVGTKEFRMSQVIDKYGAGDGARTRDLRRDRPAL
jgi:hypothetical protein